MTRVNTVAHQENEHAFAAPVFAYAANWDQHKAIMASGIEDANVWVLGRGAETLDWCLKKFRGLRGTLVIASYGRVFGDTKTAVLEAARKVELSGVKVRDIAEPEAVTLSDIIAKALRLVAGAARIRNHRWARHIGKKGGAAKGDAAAEKRNAILREEIVRKFVAESGLSKRRLEYLFCGQFTASALARHYS